MNSDITKGQFHPFKLITFLNWISETEIEHFWSIWNKDFVEDTIWYILELWSGEL